MVVTHHLKALNIQLSTKLVVQEIKQMTKKIDECTAVDGT